MERLSKEKGNTTQTAKKQFAQIIWHQLKLNIAAELSCLICWKNDKLKRNVDEEREGDDKHTDVAKE